jgi:hypothetical protein
MSAAKPPKKFFWLFFRNRFWHSLHRVVNTIVKAILFVAIVWGVFCLKASADSISYTIFGTGTGTLGNQSFSDSLFSITATADTAGVSDPNGVYIVDNSSAGVSVDGIGTGTFKFPTVTVDNPVAGAGFGAPTLGGFLLPGPGQNTTGLGLFFVISSSLSAYDLSSAFGPVSGISSFDPSFDFDTTDGSFDLTSVSTVSFEAYSVPEPSALAFCAIGSLLCFAMGIRQKA